MPTPRALLLGPHGLGTQQRHNQRRQLLTSLAGISVLAAVVLLVGLEGVHRSPATTGAAGERELLELGGASGGEGQRTRWWPRWERQLTEQETRVSAWRHRQSLVVYEETEAEEAMVASKATAELGAGSEAAAATGTLLTAKVGGSGRGRSGRLAKLVDKARARRATGRAAGVQR
ncbi:hypothetical protein D9Q98_006665 [Chlorella vulgaris]|uniref:Uncharacterized protein n=1 Tax=Chlorella vulgaris TaxID=3077 RepID=A0A9D4TKM1_CHLVU|nr:hypothetical protein D9Q98_006665 [Chlorella vulgaris]